LALENNPFYVPNESKGGFNLLADFTANFMAVRIPLAQQVFEERLRRFNDTGRREAIGDLVKQRGDLIAQRETTQRAIDDARAQAASDRVDILSTLGRLAGTETAAAATVAAAQTGAEARAFGESLPGTESGRGQLALAKAAIGKAARELQGADQAAARGVLQGLESALIGAARAVGQSDHPGALIGMSQALNELAGQTGQPAIGAVVTSVIGDLDVPTITPRGARQTDPLALSDLANQIAVKFGLTPEQIGQASPEQIAQLNELSEEPEAADRFADIEAGIAMIDGLIENIQNEDPFGGLGGFFDPLPGARQRPARGGGRRGEDAGERRQAQTGDASGRFGVIDNPFQPLRERAVAQAEELLGVQETDTPKPEGADLPADPGRFTHEPRSKAKPKAKAKATRGKEEERQAGAIESRGKLTPERKESFKRAAAQADELLAPDPVEPSVTLPPLPEEELERLRAQRDRRVENKRRVAAGLPPI